MGRTINIRIVGFLPGAVFLALLGAGCRSPMSFPVAKVVPAVRTAAPSPSLMVPPEPAKLVLPLEEAVAGPAKPAVPAQPPPSVPGDVLEVEDPELADL